MSTDIENEIEVPAQSVETQLPYFMTAKGEVVYVAESKEVLDKITEDARDSSLEFYYILGLDSPVGNDPAVMTLFKVNDNLVSRSYVPVSGTALSLTPVKNTALYKLCRIPWELMQKIEAFFRKVDKDLGGSEAIVVLGFDERFKTTDQAGWCVIVPTQNNSAGHCNYDPMSIAEFIPDEDIDYIRQVGTVHSHPGMSAFASHTDEKDQATFDGLHITIGWKGNFTEFHAEIQAAGQNFKADPDLVIDMPEAEKKDYPEFDEWESRVKKANPLGPKVQGFSESKTTTVTTPWHGTYTKYGPSASSIEGIKVPEGCPSLIDFTVVTNFLKSADQLCPVCKEKMSGEAIDFRRCRNCQTFVLLPSEEITDAIRIREMQERPVYELIKSEATRTIAFWKRVSETDHWIEQISVAGGDEGELPKVPGAPMLSQPPPPPPGII